MRAGVRGWQDGNPNSERIERVSSELQLCVVDGEGDEPFSGTMILI